MEIHAGGTEDTTAGADKQTASFLNMLIVAVAMFGGIVIGNYLGEREGSETARELIEVRAELDTTKAELRTFLKYIQPEIDSVYQMSHNRSLTYHFWRYGIRTGTPPRLLAAVAKVESNFEPGVVSRKGASGILQVMPSLWWNLVVAKCGFWQRGDSRVEICAGAYVLAYYRELCNGNYRCALSHYYSGAMTRVGQQYVEKVASGV